MSCRVSIQRSCGASATRACLEVYLTAAVFAITGSNVVALKSVTLGCFALFVCLQFVLVERLFSRAIAWMATAFLVIGPPSLVYWSPAASAEIDHDARGHRDVPVSTAGVGPAPG